MSSLDELANILKCNSKENNLQLIALEKSNCCDVGDNFCGNIYRILLKGYVTVDNEKRDYTKYVIVKENKIDDLQMNLAFKNELYAYRKIICSLKNVFNEELPIPKCIATTENFIILPDLNAEGYSCLTKRNDFNYDETIMVLKNLAKLHASSIILKQKNNLDFDEFANNIINFKFQSGCYLQLYQEVHLKFALKVLENVEQNVNVVRSINLIQNLHDHTYDMQKKLFDKRRPTDVITHGDLWCNNIMYNKMTNKILLIDLQLMICTSPAADICYFLYNCLDVNTRRINYENFLNEYLNQLKTSLNDHGIDNQMYNYNWIEDEMNEFQLYGFMSTLWMLPVFYYEKKHFDTNAKVDKIDENYLFENVTEEYKKRLIDLVLDFSEHFDSGGCASI